MHTTLPAVAFQNKNNSLSPLHVRGEEGALREGEGFQEVARRVSSVSRLGAFVFAVVAYLAAFTFFAIPTSAQAIDLTKKIQFDIPAQPLATALIRFSEQTGLQFTAPAAQLNTIETAALYGEYTTNTALNLLLKNTEFTYQAIDENTLAITTKTQSTSIASVPLRLSQVEDPKNKTNPSSTPSGVEEKLPPEEVVVTGTHIRGVRNSTVQTIVIDREQIERSGHSTTEGVLRDLPQNFAGGQSGLSDDGRFGTGSNKGTNFENANAINLRGLGESSTLVLLNGHRVAPAAYGAAVDISIIPLAAIERIEILAQGSSALYGSDAVGGVVNILLRDDYDGAETVLGYGAVTSGSRSERTAAQTFGTAWNTGNGVATLQYQDRTALGAQDREFSSGLTLPNELLPESDSFGIALNGRQDLSDAIGLHTDFLWSRRNTSRNNSALEPTLTVSHPTSRSEALSFTPGLEMKVAGDWSLAFTPSYSKQKSSQRSQRTQGLILTDVSFTGASVDLVLSGKLLETSAGGVRSALGVSYRNEELVQDSSTFGQPLKRGTKRHVSAAFGELYAPLVSEASQLKWLHALDVSIAGRYDRYSDFGTVTTPHLGLRWSPVSALNVRSAYSKSFRAPNPLETIVSGSSSDILVYPFFDSSGELIPGLAYFGSRRNLQPEKATTFSFGVDYQSLQVPGLSTGVEFYSVKYTNRIITPPFPSNPFESPDIYGSLITSFTDDNAAQAFIDEAVSSGAIYSDYVGSGVAGVRNAFDVRQQNAAIVDQRGVDFSLSYTKTLAPGTLIFRSNITYIDKIEMQLTAGSATQDLASTLGNPVNWRGRTDVAWSTSGLSLSGALNYTNHYINTSQPNRPAIGSWTTVDAFVQFELDAYLRAELWSGMALTLAVQNLFDRPPPHVDAPGLIEVSYDPANASPLERFVSVQLKKSW